MGCGVVCVKQNEQIFTVGISTLTECVCMCMCRLPSSEPTAGEASVPSRQVSAHCMCHSPAGRLSKCLISNLSV